MARTIIGLGDPKAVKRYGAFLAVDSARKSYWTRTMMGYGQNSMTPIQLLSELERDAGDLITYDLNMQLKMEPVFGDDILKDQEEALVFYTDQVYIDQVRGGVNTGGRMTRKRTIHNLRRIARQRQSDWWGRLFDELFVMYGSGARGVNDDFIFRTSFNGFANNTFSAPDADHILYGGSATSKATVAATDIFDLKLIERAVSKACTMGGGTKDTPQIQPVMVEGGEHYVIVMHPWSEYDLRTNASTGQWLDIQKASASAEGRNNPIFKGSMGMYNDVILHKHRTVIRFNDYGAGANVAASRALFLGSQAMVCAFGSPGNGLRFDWHEEAEDRGNQAVITTSSIFGIKKTVFNNIDFGVIALDVAAKDPG